ncbi:MAG: hypothetical protein NWS40_02615 [Crocinitomicaceae bacterium]|jgi:hypothetical protein|nr:hypothetical protein [Crocinitomicaceae bacterium]MDP4867078.1 hypothetical protein [Crocinitomicaceae bacterium]MDP5010054.1 hypothetical protein [Crocinitomicaceae bacterium]
MTEKEALVVIGVLDRDDDLRDLLEDALFEIKQFIISKPLISKLIDGQIKKLEKLSEVVRVLNIDSKNTANTKEEWLHQFSNESILSVLNSFELKKAKLKQYLSFTDSPSEMIYVISQLIQLQADYSACWPLVEVVEDEGVVISKEPDVMQLLVEIKKMSTEGILAFQQLTQISLDQYPAMQQELKRLSLLRKKENEWKISLKN